MEEKYRAAAGKFGTREMVLLRIMNPGSAKEKVTRVSVLGSVPTDQHGFDCFRMIEQLQLVIKTTKRQRTVLITEEDEFDFCFEGRCTVRNCPRFPKGLRVAALKPFVERQF